MVIVLLSDFTSNIFFCIHNARFIFFLFCITILSFLPSVIAPFAIFFFSLSNPFDSTYANLIASSLFFLRVPSLIHPSFLFPLPQPRPHFTNTFTPTYIFFSIALLYTSPASFDLLLNYLRFFLHVHITPFPPSPQLPIPSYIIFLYFPFSPFRPHPLYPQDFQPTLHCLRTRHKRMGGEANKALPVVILFIFLKRISIFLGLFYGAKC